MGLSVLLSCGGSSQDGDDHEDDRGDDEGRPREGCEGAADPADDEARTTVEDAVEHVLEVPLEESLEDVEEQRADGHVGHDGEQHRQGTKRNEQGHETTHLSGCLTERRFSKR